MTTYYVSPNGSDSNNGLGPDASHASNKPFLTIGKILGASGVGAAGDIVYLAPGVYREVVTVSITSPASELQILGDPANAQGFKTSGGVLVDPGYVRWTGYTTNDTTAPSANSPLNLNGRDNLTFQDILFVQSAARTVDATTATSQGITFRRCVFLPGSATSNRAIEITGAGDTALNWTIDSCIVMITNAAGSFFISSGAGTADYDLNVQIKNTLFLGGSIVAIRAQGAASSKPGGIDVAHCTFICLSGIQLITGFSTSIPNTVYNCYFYTTGTALTGVALGDIVEDYNVIFATSARSTVNTGANSTSDGSRSNLIEVGQAALWGFQPRPYGTPMIGSPLLGFGGQSVGITTDFLNRPRPAGGPIVASAGALERHDSWGRETTTVRTGSNAISCTGPGDQDFQLAVDATTTTVTVYMRYDGTHAATNKPQMKVVNGSECGVNDATATMTLAADNWEQLSLSFTPTRAGIVTIRLVSRSASASGKAFADDFAVS